MIEWEMKMMEEYWNRGYTIFCGDYKRKSDPNPHTNLIFYAWSRPGEARLATISILRLILHPQQTWTPKNAKIGPKPLIFFPVPDAKRDPKNKTKKKKEILLYVRFRGSLGLMVEI